MAIDASIYSNFLRPVKSVADYDNEYAQAEANRLQTALGQAKLGEYRSGVERKNKLAALLGGGADAQGLRRGGFQDEALAWEKAEAERAKDRSQATKFDADADKTKLETALQRVAMGSQILGGVKDQATYDMARQAVAQNFGPEAAAQMPPQYDPAMVEQRRQQGLTVQQQLEQQWKAKGYDLQVRQQNEVEQNNVRVDQRIKSEGAANRGVQLRGQNLTDARSRDLNATQRELLNQERTLKVQEMEEKAAERGRNKEAASAAVLNQIGVIDKALNHPGRETATGLSGAVDPRNYVPGTNAANFRAVLDQISGSAFLQAFQSLKGGGAITEIEGKKAEAAIARLQRTQSDAEFESALNELRGVMSDGYKRVSGKEAPARGATKPAGGFTYIGKE